MLCANRFSDTVSTHSRTEAAAENIVKLYKFIVVSTHSRTEAAARRACLFCVCFYQFQHTAARRRLLPNYESSKHLSLCFNTQPHGGGCLIYRSLAPCFAVSTHSRTEAAACAR